MNANQLRKLGVPELCIRDAIQALHAAVRSGLRGKDAQARMKDVVAAPQNYLADPEFGAFADRLVNVPADFVPAPIAYQTWGTEIDPAAHHQMREACGLPMARAAALMPDAHVGYGLPIGGVLGVENAVVPYAVGVDIACRMKMTVLDVPPEHIESKHAFFRSALEKGTVFGVGNGHEHPQDHAVMDQDWAITRITREHKDKAWRQLGSSGSGNHFVEFGVLTLDAASTELGLDAGMYTALLSHSGSRGAGAAVCDTYSRMAQARLPQQYRDFGRLAWLDLDSEAGQEYWAAMNLMGDYAAANHDVIHRLVSHLLGARTIAGVENHHNFAWKEMHEGRELIVHRKGATPAGPGVLGIIPGSMGSPAFVVAGKGEPGSLNSASHGAGRCMSRTQARDKYNFRAVQKDLEAKGVRVISAGADEVPYVYKDIHAVMAAQQDLVRTIGRFDPKLVKMSDDGRNED